ncbi:calmodulin-lysine N-methyltransferase isoform X1 [Cryptomeria japonica]|uniref:calmodulin-lysine N-methyltransferase isoform X1 n=1 Tax=Cryptomeria japonica TaxID=3369 RepID=UPI0027DA9840|nr:calmodulin-lysine N-methyltransferase isoform X1 [Cryptomeria japonica]
MTEERSAAATPIPSLSSASLRWRILRQSLLPRLKPDFADILSQEQTKQISRKPAGGFGLISNCLVEPKQEDYTGATVGPLLSTGKKDMLVEYTLPSCRAVTIMLQQRRENSVDLKDFEISKKQEIDNTGIVCLWPSEEVMTYFCILNGDMFRNKRVLELGSGYGLAGLSIAACTDATEVLITDGNPQVVDYIQNNITANAVSFGATKVTSLLLHWSQGKVCHLGQTFDFILAADCTFFEEFHLGLALTLKSLLRLSKTSRAIFFSPRRGKSLDLFLQVVRNLDLHVKVVENYNNRIWELQNEFMEQENSSWPNYDKEHCYPLLIIISLESEFLCLSLSS